jgi:hypothetical protein
MDKFLLLKYATFFKPAANTHKHYWNISTQLVLPCAMAILGG